ncbi:uncharacterized protein YqgC (DUF456 family) [Friedmanniella endophytica]|uniref:Uncharacterized protein YqgC (DUF456 family) n=1 Tax=Microlunatus kandeliicorticis TaxID=1759536 RepID=A0A7W3ISR0_9ACTN|nr:hypothetical protein [Microlunatus kandeliicorticis]MBA8794561.1 uncharacterized protein YqgC (DUF456 family) [Microlunatus kandeliicorticis]
MIDGLAYAVIAVAAVGVVWAVISTARNRTTSWALLGWVALSELVTLVQSVIGFVRLAGGFRPAEYATTVGYLIGILVLLPLATVWALTDRSRWAPAVLAVAEAGVLAMTLRLLVLWTPGG